MSFSHLLSWAIFLGGTVSYCSRRLRLKKKVENQWNKCSVAELKSLLWTLVQCFQNFAFYIMTEYTHVYVNIYVKLKQKFAIIPFKASVCPLIISSIPYPLSIPPSLLPSSLPSFLIPFTAHCVTIFYRSVWILCWALRLQW